MFFEIASRVVNLIIADSYTVESVLKILLPMHICSVMVWVFIIAVFTKKQFLLDFACIGGLLATTAFLLYPAVGLNKTYMSFTCIYSTVSHMIGFVLSILLMTLKIVRFEFKNLWIYTVMTDTQEDKRKKKEIKQNRKEIKNEPSR